MSDKPDWSPIAVDVQLRPEWQTELAEDKDLTGSKTGAVSGTTYTLINYTVTAGKTLYIWDWGGVVDGGTGTIISAINIGGVVRAFAGGNQGFNVARARPLRAGAGVAVLVQSTHFAGANRDITAHIGGYEI